MNRALASPDPLFLIAALALAGVNAGCSFIFVEGVPPDHAKMEYFDCTSTYGLSVADGVIALSGGLAAGAVKTGGSGTRRGYQNALYRTRR